MRTMTRLGLLTAAFLAAAVPSRADEKSHRKAAEDMLVAMNIQKQMESAVDQMVDLQTRSNPALAGLKAPIKRFMDKHMSFASLKDDMIKMYTEAFTESELKEMTAFYRSPVGKKMIGKTPELMAKGMQLGVKRVQDNQAELREMIEEEQRKKP